MFEYMSILDIQAVANAYLYSILYHFGYHFFGKNSENACIDCTISKITSEEYWCNILLTCRLSYKVAGYSS